MATITETVTRTNTVWKGEFEIRKTKYVQALNSNYLFIERIANTRDAKSGLYYIEIDFHELGPQSKLTEFIQKHAETELKPIVEYSDVPGISKIGLWDVKGTPLSLAISYVTKDDSESTKVVLKVLSVMGEWAVCQEEPLDGTPTVNHMEMISPPHDLSKVYVLYSTSDGLDGGKH